MKKIKNLFDKELKYYENKNYEQLFNLACQDLFFQKAQVDVMNQYLDELVVISEDPIVKEYISIVKRKYNLDLIIHNRNLSKSIDNEDKSNIES